MNELTPTTPLYCIDWQTINSWLESRDMGPATAEQVDKLMDYVFQDINDAAFDLVVSGYEDLFGEAV